jgi:2-dehydropantoate 2-reductase
VNIGVIGAGGIGSYYGGQLSRMGHSVRLLARGAHLDAIRARGLEVRSPEGSFVAHVETTTAGADLADCEYVIVAVKSYSLGEIAPALVAAAARGATIVPMLNGVDVAERLGALGVPPDATLGGLVSASLVRSAPGVVERRSPFNRMILGELTPDRTPNRAVPLVDAFAAADVFATVSDDIAHDLWRKFAFIVVMNVAAGLPRKPAGAMLAFEGGRALMADALHEIVLVSRAAGVPLSATDELEIRNELFALPPDVRPSFLADLERGGPTELDLLAGNVSRLGGVYQVPTPIHDVATIAFRAATVAAEERERL